MRRHVSEADIALARVLSGAKPDECESATLDFKEDRGVTKEIERLIVDAAICFANSAGGLVIVGVNDKVTGKEAFVGTKLDPGQVRQRVFEMTRPHLNVEAYYHEKHPNILVISVPQSSEIHSDTQGRATQRINKSCIPLTPDQQARLREERQGVDWSSKPCGRNIAEITSETLVIARTILNRFSDERKKLSTLSKEDLLTALGVVDQGGNLNNAGELLFCEKTKGSGIIYQYRSTPGGEPKNVVRLEDPFISSFARVMDLVTARRVSTPLNLPNGQQISIEDFPQLAVREALSNGICHRDYHLEGFVVVDHSPETLTVSSPGPLVAGVTISNIITVASRPRNPSLAKACRLLGFAEELGRGVDRMYREMIRSGRQTPIIEADFDRVRVALVGGAPDTNIAKFVASLPEDEQEDTDTMIVLFRLCSARTITATSVAPLLQKSIAESEAVLRRLSSDTVALIERTRATVGRTAGTYRFRSETLKKLGAAVMYQRRTADDIDRKVISHVREYGKITNRTLQNVFDIHVFKARDIISDLVRREILARTSEADRGPKVEWGPGRSFPQTRTRQRKSAKLQE